MLRYSQGKSRKSLIYSIGIALFITVVPIVVYKSIWPFIQAYYPLILALASITVGSLFVFFYLKGYSWKRMAIKIKSFFIETHDVKEYMSDRFVTGDQFYKDRSVLIFGIVMIITGFYFLIRFDKSQIKTTQEPQQGIIQKR